MGPSGRSEGFPERDIWSLGTLDQGSARCPELSGRRRRRRHLEIQVDIQARELLLKVFPRFWGHGDRYRHHIGEWRPGFYSEFRCGCREHSGLAWGAFPGKATKFQEMTSF